MGDRFYLLTAGDVAGETATGPYSKSEASMRAAADPTCKPVTAAQLEMVRQRPKPDDVRAVVTQSD